MTFFITQVDTAGCLPNSFFVPYHFVQSGGIIREGGPSPREWNMTGLAHSGDSGFFDSDWLRSRHMTHSNQRHKGISTLARGFLEQFLLFCHLCLLSQQYVILGATAAILWSWGWSQENHREAETEPWCCWAAKSPRHFLLDFQLCEIRYVLIVKATSFFFFF